MDPSFGVQIMQVLGAAAKNSSVCMMSERQPFPALGLASCRVKGIPIMTLENVSSPLAPSSR